MSSYLAWLLLAPSAQASTPPIDDTGLPTVTVRRGDASLTVEADPAPEAQDPPDVAPPQPVDVDDLPALEADGDEGADGEDGEGPPVDEEALPSADDGLWEWVEKLGGEIPTEAQLRSIEEAQAEQTDSQLVEALEALDVDPRMYADPAAALYVDPLFLDQVDPSEFDIPVEVNGSVAKWVKYFTGPGRKYYQRWLTRSSRYRPMMYAKLEEAGLPADLVYLSMIESGYNAHAYSHAHAAGLWQFIPSTGRLYKLRVDYWVDDRRDPALSTDAAIAFLSELHTLFKGDWRLAWAAYNTGPGRVKRAIRNAGTTDFWQIQAGPYLANETDNYVPKIMAAAIIGKHPERYGFTDIAFEDELVYDEVRVDGSVEVAALASAAGVSVDEFRYLNPALRRYATPKEGYTIRVPRGAQQQVTAKVAQLPRAKPVEHVRYTVRRGDTLSRIASRHGVSVDVIRRANRLQNVDHIRIGMSLLIPKGPGALAEASAPVASSGSRSAPTTSTYVVRRGDTLSGIAERHGTTTSTLRSLNGISGSRIVVGQKLQVRGAPRAATTASASTSTSTHVVARGETLGRIAARYGTSTSTLQKLNGIRDASAIQAGQRLKVPGSAAPAWKTYTVQRGDSLGKIASASGCSVSDIQSWNKLSGTTIHPGQQLKVRN